uniref:Membrane-associated kinase regulator 1 n=1 Tax=Kalanchoe fedtschenkoi TaxID=63787 RepID=A0A7N0TZ23_KALFE
MMSFYGYSPPRTLLFYMPTTSASHLTIVRQTDRSFNIMGGRSGADKKARLQSHTLPSSPSHSSSSSSDFEFRICSSPPNNNSSSSSLCPADDLFYRGQLLPLHPSPRLSMVRSLLLASSSTSSSSAASRDSSGSSSSSDVALFADYNCDSSRPSSVADLEDEFIMRPLNGPAPTQLGGRVSVIKTNKYFSVPRFSSVFNNKEPRRTAAAPNNGGAASKSVKRMSASARDVFSKYVNRVKPWYDKLSQKQKIDGPVSSCLIPSQRRSGGSVKASAMNDAGEISHSFSGYPRRKRMVSSCPSSIRSSPCHSGILTRAAFPIPSRTCSSIGGGGCVDSSMEELQNAIQGAIAHCKNSMLQNKSHPLVGNAV